MYFKKMVEYYFVFTTENSQPGTAVVLWWSAYIHPRRLVWSQVYGFSLVAVAWEMWQGGRSSGMKVLRKHPEEI